MSREVAEEVGLEVHSISYSSSQHWPFPNSSFMLGCHASVIPANTQVSTDSINNHTSPECSCLLCLLQGPLDNYSFLFHLVFVQFKLV